MECREAERNVQRYIEGRLTERECAAFISHVRNCRSCYDELETYFTIDYALRPDEADTASKSFDMKRVIERNLAETEDSLRRTRSADMFLNAFVAVSEICLILLLVYRFLPERMTAIVTAVLEFLANYA